MNLLWQSIDSQRMLGKDNRALSAALVPHSPGYLPFPEYSVETKMSLLVNCVQVNELRVYTQVLTGAWGTVCSQMWLASGWQCLSAPELLRFQWILGAAEAFRCGGGDVCDSVSRSPWKTHTLFVFIIIHLMKLSI